MAGPGHFNFRHFGEPQGIIPATLDGSDLEQVLAAYLKADASVASVVGARVFPISAPQTAELPHLVFRLVSGGSVHHLGGYSGISTARIRLSAKSRLLRDCVALRECVRQLNGFKGRFGPVRVDYCRFRDVVDRYEQPDDTDTGTFSRQFDLLLKYRESIPSN